MVFAVSLFCWLKYHMQRLRCYTLFDITQTGVANRNPPINTDLDSWVNRRNTQCNFDTILQIMSMRSQPEVIDVPQKTIMTPEYATKFGTELKGISHFWQFTLDVQHARVFENDADPLGALYNDCDRVPMIVCRDQHQDTSAFLRVNSELKNIHFEVLI